MKKLINLWPSIKHKTKINVKIILHYHYNLIKINIERLHLKTSKNSIQKTIQSLIQKFQLFKNYLLSKTSYQRYSKLFKNCSKKIFKIACLFLLSDQIRIQFLFKKSCTLYSQAIEHVLIYASIKNGIQLSALNICIVNVRVVLSASNIMRAALFCIRQTLSSHSLLHDDQIGLRFKTRV